MSFARGPDPAIGGGMAPDGRPVKAHFELRRDVRSDRLCEGSLACPSCDAPVAIGPRSASLGDELRCPFCRHAAPARDFLSLATPTRPARVVVRIGTPLHLPRR